MAERLRNEGVRVWFDQWRLLPGHHPGVEINKAITTSRKMVAVWSPQYFGKEWSRAEVFASHHGDLLSQDRPVIPVLIAARSTLDIPPTLQTLLTLNFTNPDDFEIRFRTLIKSLDLPKLDDSASIGEIELDHELRSERGRLAHKRGKRFEDEVATLYRLLGFDVTDVSAELRPALSHFSKWLGDDQGNLPVVLGDLGSGKSTLSGALAYQLARSFRDDPLRHPAPVLIPLGEVRKEVSLDSIVVKHFRDRGIHGLNFPRFAKATLASAKVEQLDCTSVDFSDVNWDGTMISNAAFVDCTGAMVATGPGFGLSFDSTGVLPMATERMRSCVLEPIVQLGSPSTVNAVAWSPDGHYLAAGGADGIIRLYSANDRLLRTVAGHKGSVRSVSFDPWRGLRPQPNRICPFNDFAAVSGASRRSGSPT